MDYFDLAEEVSGGEGSGKLADAFAGHAMGKGARFFLISFDSDWLYPTAESRHVVHALNSVGAPVSFVELSAPHGHDSFLLDEIGRASCRGKGESVRVDLVGGR